MSNDPGAPNEQPSTEPTIVAEVRAIRDAAHLADDERNVEILRAILGWLDEHRILDEEGVVVWAVGPSDRVVAEGRRRLVRTTGQYAERQVPTSCEITASDLFARLNATPIGVVRRIKADLPHHAPRVVAEGLDALEALLTA